MNRPERDSDDDLTREVDALPRMRPPEPSGEARASRLRYERRQRAEKRRRRRRWRSAEAPPGDLWAGIIGALLILFVIFLAFVIGYTIGRVP